MKTGGEFMFAINLLLSISFCKLFLYDSPNTRRLFINSTVERVVKCLTITEITIYNECFTQNAIVATECGKVQYFEIFGSLSYL